VSGDLFEGIVHPDTVPSYFIASPVRSRKPEVVGTYRLMMNKSASTMLDPAMQGVMKSLKAKSGQMIAYEPTIEQRFFIILKYLTILVVLNSLAM
jgi:UDPglucose 6-dehydrogenase